MIPLGQSALGGSARLGEENGARQESLQDQLGQVTGDARLLDLLLELTFHHQASGAGERAEVAAEHAMLVAERMDNPVSVGLGLWARGLAHRATRNYRGALEDGVTAMRVFEQCSSLDERAWAQISLGVLHHELGEDIGAINYLTEALGTGRQTGNHRLEAAGLQALGGIAAHGGQYDRAGDYGVRALALRRGCGTTTEVIQSLALLAEAALLQTRDLDDVSAVAPLLDGAREHLDEGLALAWRYGNRNLEGPLLAFLGEVMVGTGQPEAVVTLITTVLPELDDIDNRAGLCRLLSTLGTAYAVLDEDEAALGALERALGIAEKADVPVLLQPLHRDLARVHERLGDLGAALAHHKAYHDALRRGEIARAAEQSRLHAVRLEIEESRREAARLRSQAAALQTEIRGLQLRSRQLDALAREDWLTGLANRRTLDQWLSKAIGLARTHMRPLTIALADIDHFKQINDTYSHQIGDAVLREAARILCRHVRRSDLVARYGGEEFVLAFPDATVQQVAVLCERIRGDIERHDWSRLAAKLRVTVSVGIADGSLSATAEEALARADERMYRAKRDGRNLVHPAPYAQGA